MGKSLARFKPARVISNKLHSLWLKATAPFVPPGHFYSPLPSLKEIRADEDRIFRIESRSVPGIDLREEEQLSLLRQFIEYYKEAPFREHKQDNLRYLYKNETYSYSDAIFLYCMLRHASPRRLIEIGSGYSSCATLDVNQVFFNNSIECIFIDPYPELLLSLIKGEDRERIEIIPKRLQDVGIEPFKTLKSGDILFIDSTHVSKIDSDVNHILFRILPELDSGVYIHFHDIFYPFEYPRDWVYKGRAWNENYILKAFLQYNSSFEIVLFNTFLEIFHRDIFQEHMPLCLKDTGGSIWIRKK